MKTLQKNKAMTGFAGFEVSNFRYHRAGITVFGILSKRMPDPMADLHNWKKN